MVDEEVKTFTQEHVNDIVEKRLMRERDKFKEEVSTITAERDNLKGELESTKLNTLKTDLLSKAGISQEWAPKITGKSQAEMESEIASFKQLIENSKPAPEPVGSDTNPANTKPVIFSRESVKKMSPQEINDNWADIQKALKSGI
ncbi:MAG: hypothetical protein NTV15_08840 [Candidatus Bathyarchaeota archaeon]|nr:hypothetical protein [Candidatus Bathyarchaeota archaeon]